MAVHDEDRLAHQRAPFVDVAVGGDGCMVGANARAQVVDLEVAAWFAVAA